MVSYMELPGEPKVINIEYLSKTLKTFAARIKEYIKAKPDRQDSLMPEIDKLKNNLESYFGLPCENKSDKLKLRTLENNYRELCWNYSEIVRNYDENAKSMISSSSLGLEEHESLEIQNLSELRNQELIERKGKIEKLYEEMIIVNEMFVDTAKIVQEQGEMIDKVDGNLNVAVKVNDKIVKDLEDAKRYQESSKKKKIICILIIVAIAVIVVLGYLFKDSLLSLI